MRSNEEIVDIIKELMKQKDMSLSELARRTNSTKSSLSRYLNKTRKFPIHKVKDFANELNTTTKYILGFEVNEGRKQARLDEYTSDLTDEEVNEVIKYIEFLKSKRKG